MSSSRSPHNNTYVNDARSFFEKLRDKTGVPKQCHRSKVHSLAWNATGNHLASGSADKTASIYSIKGRLSKDFELKGHTESVDQLCWNPTRSNYLGTASADKTVRIWDSRVGGKATKTISTAGENINICWSPDGNTIAVGNKDDNISFIDTKMWKVTEVKKFNFEVNEISWDNTGKNFYMTTGQGSIHILSYPDLKDAVPPITAHAGNCLCITFDPKGRYFATGSADSLASLWDVDELICVQTYSRPEWPVRGLSFSHDGQMIATASEDPFVDIAFVETGEKLYQIPAQEGSFTVAWHPRLVLLAFAGDEKDRDGRDAGLISLFGVPDKSSA